jgi:hypothetical protein
MKRSAAEGNAIADDRMRRIADAIVAVLTG